MSALAELSASLPTWVRLGPRLFYPCLALGTIVPLTWLLESWLLRRYRRLDPSAPTSERARLGFPARSRLASWAFSATMLVSMTWLLWLGPLTPVASVLVPIVAVSAITWLALQRATRETAPGHPAWSPRALVSAFALGHGRGVVLLLAALLAGPRVDAQSWGAWALALLATLGWSFAWPTKLARRVGLFRAPPPALAREIEAIARRLGVPIVTPSVAALPSANAYALGATGELVLSEALLRALPEGAIGPAIEHELRAVPRARARRASALAASLVLTLLTWSWPVLGAVSASAALAFVAAVLATAAAIRSLGRLARSRPEEALFDEGYARVVLHVHELEAVPTVLAAGGSRRPSVYDRLARSGIELDFPRPAAPPRMLLPLASCFALAVVALMGTRIALAWAEHGYGERLSVMHVVLATTGGDPRSFERLAYARLRGGDLEGALVAYGAASALEPDAVEPRAIRAHLLVLRGECDRAIAATWDASVLAERTGRSRDRALASRIRRELERCVRVGEDGEDEDR